MNNQCDGDGEIADNNVGTPNQEGNPRMISTQSPCDIPLQPSKALLWLGE